LAIYAGTGKRKMEDMTKDISKKEFKKEVMESAVLSLVKFTMEWSGACQIISPVYEELAGSYKSNVNFFTVDAEKEKSLDNEYGVMEFPTILFFKNGKIIDHIIGLTSRAVIITKIENAMTEVNN
jgi:thioredoxin 1